MKAPVWTKDQPVPSVGSDKAPIRVNKPGGCGMAGAAPVCETVMEAACLSRTHGGADADGEFAQAFLGCSFTRLFAPVSRDQLGETIGIFSAIGNLGGDLASLRLTRVAGKPERCFGLTGLLPAQARMPSNRLSAVTGIGRAIVEHQILRLPAAGGRTVNGAACERGDLPW